MNLNYNEVLNSAFDKIKDLKVLIIGDTIIDEYFFTVPKGRAMKDPVLSTNYSYHERYAGGVLATANHVSNFVKNIDLITLLGDKKRNEEFISGKINSNIKVKFFTKKNSFTTIKRRFVDKLRGGKLFKIEYINDKPIEKELESDIIDYLYEKLSDYDLVIVNDFGHGFINNNIINVLEEKSKFICANIQTNSANLGFNYYSKYKKLDYITMNEPELRLGTQCRFEPLDEVAKKFYKLNICKKALITMGKEGAFYLQDNEIYHSKSFNRKLIDTVGAGDAVFAITSLLVHANIEPKKLPFFANCVGGIAIQIVGNKENINKERLLSFIKEVNENELGNV